jgi:hypothetical protein
MIEEKMEGMILKATKMVEPLIIMGMGASIAGLMLAISTPMFDMEPRVCPDLNTLLSANLIDPSLTTATAPYTYTVAAPPDNSSFTATATRTGSAVWSGSFSIAADGTVAGSVQQSGQGASLVPGFQ